jgi:hypothetical protein
MLRGVDRLLRGDVTRAEDLRAGRIDASARSLAASGLALGAAYGAFMGIYAVLAPGGPGWDQWLSTTLKVPTLFLLTLLVTFPSLYVISTLCGSRLRYEQTLRLLLAAVTVNLALLASLGPVTAFFTLSTDSHPFLVLLNVLFFAVSGFVGLGFLKRALRAVFDVPPPPPLAASPLVPPNAGIADPGAPAAAASTDGEPPASRLAAAVAAAPGVSTVPVRRDGRSAPDPGRRVFRIWTLVYAVVGCQMAWILRPFLGQPGDGFVLFGERRSNFFAGVPEVLRALFS